MTDGGAAFQPGRGEPPPFRLRGAYVGHEVFGHGAGAVLVDPEVARDLRSAAESASQERRIAGGLLYGRVWADDEGGYLVVDGFLEAGPGENPGDRITREGRDSFTLADTDLRLLREDAARMYSGALEVGWWRTLADPGEFGPTDFATQRELVGPGGVGLLVFGSGLEWGTAYLGPDGQVPGSARSFIPVSRPATEAPLVPTRELGPLPATLPEPDAYRDADDDANTEQEPRPVTAVATPGTSLAPRRPVLTPAPRPTGPRAVSPIPVPSQEWGVKRAYPSYVGPKTPADVKIVVGALVVTAIVAATIIGVLVSNALVAVIVAVVSLLAIGAFLWMSRL